MTSMEMRRWPDEAGRHADLLRARQIRRVVTNAQYPNRRRADRDGPPFTGTDPTALCNSLSQKPLRSKGAILPKQRRPCAALYGY